MRIFGREPAVILAFIAVALKLLAGFGVDVSAEQQTLINAVLAALVGVISAAVLKNGALYAAILGLAQAAMALFVGFGLDWTAEKQALVMSVVAGALAIWERERVQPPVPAVGLEQSSPVKGV